MSMGLEMAKVAEYSTMPRALRGANWMSVMMALCGSFGIEFAEEMAAQGFILAGLAEVLRLCRRATRAVR